MQYGNKGDASWNFDGIDSQSQSQAPETALMTTMDISEAEEEGDDATSTTAILDNDNTTGPFDRMDEDFDTAGQNTPADSDNEYRDQHHLYSFAHEQQGMDSLHLEDTGFVGELEGDGPVEEIYPPDPLFPEEHEKMD